MVKSKTNLSLEDNDCTSAVFVSYEEEIKKLYTLLSSLDTEKVDVEYMKEKLLGAINKVPIILYPPTERKHMRFWQYDL